MAKPISGASLKLYADNNYRALNPATGKYELVYATPAVSQRPDPAYGGVIDAGTDLTPYENTYYLESDRPSDARQHTFQDDRSSIVEPIVKGGLQAIASLGGPVISGLVGGALAEDGNRGKGVGIGALSGLIGSYFGGGGSPDGSAATGAYGGFDSGAVAGADYGLGGAEALGGASELDLAIGGGADQTGFDPNFDAGGTGVKVYNSGADFGGEGVGYSGTEMGGVTPTTTPSLWDQLVSGTQNFFKGTGANGTYTLEDLLKLQLGGKAVAGTLGLLGSRQRERRQEEQAREFDSRTRPYRVQLAELEKDPTAYLNSPAVQGPVQQGTDALARALSVKFGNPTGSGTALQELQNYASTALSGNLQNEKRRLAALSGIPNAAAAYPGASQAAIDAERGIYDVAGSMVYDVTNPKPTLEQLLEVIRKMNAGGTNTTRSGYTGAPA